MSVLGAFKVELFSALKTLSKYFSSRVPGNYAAGKNTLHSHDFDIVHSVFAKLVVKAYEMKALGGVQRNDLHHALLLLFLFILLLAPIIYYYHHPSITSMFVIVEPSCCLRICI